MQYTSSCTERERETEVGGKGLARSGTASSFSA